jgi:pyruvate/2-oxoglutarate/acetoin dehydrogenase E1 component
MSRVLSGAGALQEAVAQEMERDPTVFVFGIGVDDFRGLNGTTKGLAERFGRDRCFDTPLSEDAMTGFAIGAALAGWRPVHCHMRMDFMLLGMNQLVNIAAKARYMFGGQVSLPLVVRSIIGRSWGQGAQHSQGLHSLFMHIPGLKIFAPSTPYDSKGCLVSAIRDPDPVLMIEHRMVHTQRGHVPEELYTVPFGRARVLRAGTDVTIVGISYMAVEAMRAAMLLETAGVSAEVVDPVSLAPLDVDGIAASVNKTGRLIVVDTDWTNCGAATEIVTAVLERLSAKHVPFRRMGYAAVPCPTTKNLENLYYPNPRTIAENAHQLVRGRERTFSVAEAAEIVEFKGPF